MSKVEKSRERVYIAMGEKINYSNASVEFIYCKEISVPCCSLAIKLIYVLVIYEVRPVLFNLCTYLPG